MGDKIYVGMMRQDWQDFRKSVEGGLVLCNCGSTLETIQSLREHWQLGHFDTPVYKTIPSIEIKVRDSDA